MSRGVWFVAGAASGVYALVKVRRIAQAFTPAGVAARVAALRAGAEVFTEAVAEARDERETELCWQLEHGVQLPRLIGPAPARRVLASPGVTSVSDGAAGAQ